MVRIFFAACAAVLFVWGPGVIQPQVKAPVSGVGLVKTDRVFVAQAVARIIDER